MILSGCGNKYFDHRLIDNDCLEIHLLNHSLSIRILEENINALNAFDLMKYCMNV